MPLIGLLSTLDSPEVVSQWSFQHAQDHNEIDQHLLALGVVSPQVPLDPMPAFDQAEAWLFSHALKHQAMNAAYGLTGDDLGHFDLAQQQQLTEFADLNYSEHDAVHQTGGF
jgi:hypothetical protein